MAEGLPHHGRHPRFHIALLITAGFTVKRTNSAVLDREPWNPRSK